MKKVVIANLILTCAVIIYLILQVVLPHKMALGGVNEGSLKEYILANPETIIASLEGYQEQQAASQEKEALAKLQKMGNGLLAGKDDPRVGAANGKIKIIEFFDYSCGYCHKMLKVKQQILENNQDVEIIFKELPIMGDISTMKTKASLAFFKVSPAKYLQYQEELFKVRSNADKVQTYINLAAQMGVTQADFKKVFEQMLNDDSIVKGNIKLAMDLGLRGTPAYIIGNEILPGYANYETFNEKISAQRARGQ